MEFKQKLYEEIEEEFDNMKGIKIGTNDLKTAVETVTKLVDRAIEIDKIEYERNEKLKKELEDKIKAMEAEAREAYEKECKLKALEEEKRDRWWRRAIDIGGIVIPVGLTVWGTIVTLRFEREGTVTTIIGRGFFNKLLKK